ncbi:MAG: hypothetical protein HYU48_02310 [Candidatus Levybacteria bacterium]|nr:hypothetical protein [Candidatus Levybacteria bacterium]
MSHLLTVELAKQAIDLVRPAISAVLGSGLTGGRPNLHLVILNPGTDRILHEESFGEEKRSWEYPFDEYARAKALLCQRTGIVGRTVQRDAPWLYEELDTRYVGGVIENGLVIAASGVQDHFDEMISWWILSAIQGLCRDAIALTADAPDFFGR